MRLTLRPSRLPEGIRVDAAILRPDRSFDLDARIPVGNRPEALGDLFSIEAGDTATLEIEGDLRRFDRLGAGMTSGTLIVRGDAGSALGSEQTGGVLRITGSAGRRAGEGHRGGALLIDGAAGDDLGAPLPGRRHGLSGGLVAVGGNAGDGAGRRMRRGVLVIGGDSGAEAGLEMLAGTMILLGRCGPGFGALMKRGTIVLQEPCTPLSVFAPSGVGRFSFLRLYHDALTAAGITLPRDFSETPRRRLVGDRSGGGLGEILMSEER